MKLSTIVVVLIALLSLTPFAAYLYKNLESEQALTQTVYAPAAVKNGDSKPANSVTSDAKTQSSTVTVDKAKKQQIAAKKKPAIEVKYPAADKSRFTIGY